jgi:glyoxylase-like metal-dependent hydrolase (beta-lactamase superfamily II)
MNVALVLAPNPSLMTGPGTNTWVVINGGEALVVDPGPLIAAHLDSVASALGETPVRAILVTHTHPDHAPAANPLAERLNAPVIGSAAVPGFRPDRLVADGETVDFGNDAIAVIATPGHTADSVSYRLGDALFTGDHIIGGSTVMVENMAAYMNSLERLQGTGLNVLYPGHGPVLDDPDTIISHYIEHRLEREAQILDAINAGAVVVGDVVQAVYADVDPGLHPAAAISVDAHLRRLEGLGLVAYDAEGEIWTREVEAR